MVRAAKALKKAVHTILVIISVTGVTAACALFASWGAGVFMIAGCYVLDIDHGIKTIEGVTWFGAKAFALVGAPLAVFHTIVEKFSKE